MKAISVKQPWASMIADKRKTIETRRWRTAYRGDLLIVSTARPVIRGFPNGKALCVAELIDCRPMVKADERAARCKVYASAYAWVLSNIREIQHFKVKGCQRLYEVPGVNFCKLCGWQIAEWSTICGECACEDDGV